MAHRVYEVPSREKSKLDQYLQTDPVSRLSITTKDARPFGIDRPALLLFLEGDEEILKQTQPELEKLGATLSDKGDQYREQLKAEEDEAAGGVGFIFG